MVEEPISILLRFGHGPILVQMNLQHRQAQSYCICTRVIYLTQTQVYVEHHTEKQLVRFLKSLVWLGLGRVNYYPDLPNSKRTLHHYTTESVDMTTLYQDNGYINIILSLHFLIDIILSSSIFDLRKIHE